MTRICWRSDGEFFAINFFETLSNSRKFQVYTREGLLHSTIEDKINILDSPISWKYSKSSLIATSVYRFNKHEIVFFERNGLTHGSFVLPFKFCQMKVNQISWNLDSTLLCIWAESIESNKNLNSQYTSVIQIWYTSNCHWYLKQTYNFDAEDKISVVSWDSEDSLILHTITVTGRYLKYNFGWTINLSNCIENYNGSIAVIDGESILLTPFRKKNIPPPMCHLKVNCTKAVNKIIWSPQNLDLLVHSFDDNLLYFKCNDVEGNAYELIGMSKLEIKNKSIFLQHILWISPLEVLTISIDSTNSSSVASYSIEITDSQDKKNVSFIKRNAFSIKDPVYNAVFNSKSNTLLLVSLYQQNSSLEAEGSLYVDTCEAVGS